MRDQMTPEERTCKIAQACDRMRQAETRAEQERVLEELTRLIRTPTSERL